MLMFELSRIFLPEDNDSSYDETYFICYMLKNDELIESIEGLENDWDYGIDELCEIIHRKYPKDFPSQSLLKKELICLDNYNTSVGENSFGHLYPIVYEGTQNATI